MGKWIWQDGLWGLFGWSAKVVEMTVRFTGYTEVLSFRHPRYEVAVRAELLWEGDTVGTIGGNTSIPSVVDWRDPGAFEHFKLIARQWFEMERESAQGKSDVAMLEALEEMEFSDSIAAEFIREMIRKNSVSASRAINQLVLHRAALR